MKATAARPAAGAAGSVPLAWDELDDPDLRPDRWTIRTVLGRLAETDGVALHLPTLWQRSDPWR